jgi:hypothetical protein
MFALYPDVCMTAVFGCSGAKLNGSCGAVLLKK